MATSPAARRLKRILDNEDYGPKLARMNRQDERYILDLIDRNEGKKARSEILRLDKNRRIRRRNREQNKKVNYVIDKNVMRRKAVDNIIRQVDGKPSTVNKLVEYMTDDELTFAAQATRSEIREKASHPSYTIAPDLGYEINPFWYN